MNILLFSTKRSTHHAFLESVLTDKKYFYENNIVYHKDREVVSETVGDRKFSHNLHVKSFEMNYRIEDILLPSVMDESWLESKKIIFLRDPLNTLASTLSVFYKFYGTEKSKKVSWVERNVKLWADLYKTMKCRDGEFVFIYANRFWSDKCYRSSVSEWFGGGVRDVTELSKFGGGGNTFFPSTDNAAISFDDIDTRYLVYKDDAVFLSFLNQFSDTIEESLLDLSELDKLEFFKSLVR